MDINKQLKGYEDTFKPSGMASNIFWELVEIVKLEESKHSQSLEEIEALRRRVGAL